MPADAAMLSGSRPFGIGSLADKHAKLKSVCREEDSVFTLTKDSESSNIFDVFALELLLDGEVDTSSSEGHDKRRDCDAEVTLLFLSDWLYDEVRLVESIVNKAGDSTISRLLVEQSL